MLEIGIMNRTNISKLLRLSDNDEQDIKGLIQRRLVDKEKLIELATKCWCWT